MFKPHMRFGGFPCGVPDYRDKYRNSKKCDRKKQHKLGSFLQDKLSFKTLVVVPGPLLATEISNIVGTVGITIIYQFG